MIPAFLAPLLLKLSPVGRILKSIPRPVWIALLVIGILLLGTCAHKRSVKRFGDERYAAGVKAEAERIAAKAFLIKSKADAISNKLRSVNNETNRRISADARTVLVRGPGKASCFNSAIPSPGRRVAPIGETSHAVAEVPDSERVDVIGLPFTGAVKLVEEHDLCISEASTWREDKKQQEEAWRAAQ